ncbi:hypothetical protein E4M02_11085 [Brevundimonas sp. S30B]|uniref:hypothetical protein n=1 Tax=unclassified Brevundimonas TaxID=2622653 RepID=UPI001072BF64|nr:MULTISPECIES: hypothetical protein [unclassified Brevundimonas]QBX38658.1 hypothetical protein E4M01_13345 [Brevundimonas sp. MF30-B]TFW01249.1 hypothetical protein E4M02_11085 [Brevundimonas sp. S30B]
MPARSIPATCNGLGHRIDETKVNIGELTANLRIRVYTPMLFSFRLKASAWVMRLAGWIAGIPVDVAIESERLRLLPEDQWKIDRRAGCIYVSTHDRIGFDGTYGRTWQRIPLTS